MCEIKTFNYIFFLLFLQVVGKTSFTVRHIFHTKKNNVCSVLSDRPNNLTERILYLFVYRVGVVNHPHLIFATLISIIKTFSATTNLFYILVFRAGNIFFLFLFLFCWPPIQPKDRFDENSKCFSFFILFRVWKFTTKTNVLKLLYLLYSR